MLVRVGDVFGIRHGLDVPGAAVEGVAEGPDARADIGDGVFGGGDVREEDEAVDGEVREGFVEGGFGAHVRVVGNPFYGGLHYVLVPCDRFVVVVAR